MSLIALASAKGSPGVSTIAYTMALCWPPERPVVVVEADPAGSALAPRFGLPYDRGVISLAPATRHAFDPSALGQHVQRLAVGAGRSSVDALVGVRSAEQSRGLARFWADVSAALAADPSFDAIVDCGRLDPQSPAMAAVHHAQFTLLLTRPDIESVLHTALRVQALAETGARTGAIGVVVVGDGPHKPGEVANATGAEVLALIPHDPRGALILAGASDDQRALARSGLLRAVQGLCTQVGGRLRAVGAAAPRRPEPAEGPPPRGAPEVVWSEQRG